MLKSKNRKALLRKLLWKLSKRQESLCISRGFLRKHSNGEMVDATTIVAILDRAISEAQQGSVIVVADSGD